MGEHLPVRVVVVRFEIGFFVFPFLCPQRSPGVRIWLGTQ